MIRMLISEIQIWKKSAETRLIIWMSLITQGGVWQNNRKDYSTDGSLPTHFSQKNRQEWGLIRLDSKGIHRKFIIQVALWVDYSWRTDFQPDFHADYQGVTASKPCQVQIHSLPKSSWTKVSTVKGPFKRTPNSLEEHPYHRGCQLQLMTRATNKYSL